MNSSFSLLLVASADVKMYLFPEKSIPVYLILKKVFLFKGNYSEYLIQKAIRMEQHKSSYKNQQKKIKETEKFIERFRYKSTKSSQVQSRVKSIKKLEKIEEPEQMGKQLNLIIPNKLRSPLKIISLNNVSKNYDKNIVFKNLKFEVERNANYRPFIVF